ncbi:MAG: MotA/TolQ/ExbB proton channel family protein [bacterium JZ-2024 1]
MVFNLFVKGGIVMYPLLLCSILAVYIIVDRIRNLRQATINSRELLTKAKTLLLQGNETALRLLLDETPGPVSRVLLTGYELRSLPREEIVEGVKETAITEIQRMNRFLPTLSTIVSVSTLLGLLGTILGLIQIFNVISGGGIGDAEALAAGIAQALITTAFGLMIAIPALIFHNYLAEKVDLLAADMEKSLHELVNFIKMEGVDKSVSPVSQSGWS